MPAAGNIEVVDIAPVFKALFKGYPEYRPDQPRDDGGRFAGGSGTGEGGRGLRGSNSMKAIRAELQRRFPGADVKVRKDREFGDPNMRHVQVDKTRSGSLELYVHKEPGRALGFSGIMSYDEGAVGHAFAKRALRTVLDMAEASDSPFIELYAVQVGSYLWPKIGFELDTEQGPSAERWIEMRRFDNRLDSVADRLEVAAGIDDLPARVSNEIADILEDIGPNTPHRLASLSYVLTPAQYRAVSGHDPVGKPTLGKALLIETGGFYRLPKAKYGMLRKHVSVRKALGKGYPEYDDDQARDEGGKWVAQAQARSVSGRDNLDVWGRSSEDLQARLNRNLPPGSGLTASTWSDPGGKRVIYLESDYERRPDGSSYRFANFTMNLVAGKRLEAEFFEAEDSPRGRAAARVIMGLVHRIAMDSGATEIVTDAGLELGGYVWPRLGFELVTKTDQNDFYYNVMDTAFQSFWDGNRDTYSKVEATLRAQRSYDRETGTFGDYSPNMANAIAKLDDPVPMPTTEFGQQRYKEMQERGRGKPTLGKFLLMGTGYKYRLPRAKFARLTAIGGRVGKGYPEYDENQPRGEGGKWTSDGAAPGPLTVGSLRYSGAGDRRGVPATYDDESGSMNPALRAGVLGALRRRGYRDLIASIDEALKVWTTSENATVWRMVPPELVSELKEGDTLKDEAFVSVSSRRLEGTAARQRPRPAIMEIVVPAGTNIAPVNGRPADEFLLPRGTRFRYLGNSRFEVLPALGKGNPEFDPDQPRGNDGKWTGGGGSAAPNVSTANKEAVEAYLKGRFPGAEVTVQHAGAVPYANKPRGPNGWVDIEVKSDAINASLVWQAASAGKPNELTIKGLYAKDSPEGRKAAVNAMAVIRALAAAAGVDFMVVQAGGTSGGYVWPHLGFEHGPGGESAVASAVSKRLSQIEEHDAGRWMASSIWLTPEQVSTVRAILIERGPNMGTKLAHLNDPVPEAAMERFLLGARGRRKPTLGKLMLMGIPSSPYRLPRAKFAKGNPEYNPDQARGEDGKWTGGSDSDRLDSRKPLTDEQRARRNAQQRARYAEGIRRSAEGRAAAVQAARLEREAAARAARTAKYREVPNLISRQGAVKAEDAIKEAMTAIPQEHYNFLKQIRMIAVMDLARGEKTKNGRIAGFFLPLIGLVVGQTFDGFELPHPTLTAVHEMAHALDYYSRSGPGKGKPYALSRALWPVMAYEWDNLAGSEQWYAEHYKAADHGKELFAELYMAVYAPDIPEMKDKNFMGVGTRADVLRAFPKTVSIIRGMSTIAGIKQVTGQIREQAAAAPAARSSWWSSWW